MNREFSDKVVFITGAGGGIGQAVAKAFAEQGARVAVTDLDGNAAEKTAHAISANHGTALSLTVDVTKKDSVKRAVAATVERFGGLHYAVNNAGIGGAAAATADYPDDIWDLVMRVNLTGVRNSMQAQIPHMLEHGGGAIVNVASVAGVCGFPKASAYAAAKHGVIGLTKSAALEYATHGIRINAVCPGYTQTAMVEHLEASRPEIKGKLHRAIPLRRLGRPEEIAGAVLYLCSQNAGFCVGHAMVLDGGLRA